jgi:hypothetical protein
VQRRLESVESVVDGWSHDKKGEIRRGSRTGSDLLPDHKGIVAIRVV